MIKIYDRVAMAHVMARDLDPRLRALLEQRFASLVSPDGDLTDWTEWLILEPGDGEIDIVREIGFSPLGEPIDGARFGGAGFQPFWDHLTRHEGWGFEMIVSFGSTFAYILLIPETDGIDTTLLTLCRHYADSSR
jgi:hypothetical protein